MLLDTYSYTLVNISCLPSSTLFNAVVELDDDVSQVLPYLNAVLPRGNYSHEAKVLDFMHEGHIVSLTPREMRVTGIEDDEHARRVIADLVEMVNHTWERRETIEPVQAQIRPPAALEVFRFLPRTNCGDCGVPTCMAFASLVSSRGHRLDECPRLAEPEWSESLLSLRALMGL